MSEKQPKQEVSIKQVNARLTSLGRPRDLLLSGAATSKPKKVFAPNVNAVRNKGKAVPNLSSDGTRKNVRKQSKEFKKRDGEASRFVQSTGIFSEGTMEIKRESTYSSRSSDARDGGGEPSAGMEKPTITADAVWNVDLQEEAKVISDLLDNGTQHNKETDHDEYQPVVLPLSKNKQNFFTTFAPQPLHDIKVKQEVNETDKLSSEFSQCSFHDPTQFSDANVTYSLVKLPDSMPGRGFDEEGKVTDYTLDQMVEGQIGKIVKRKSGRMQIVIGELWYDLDSVEGASFTEELMAMPEAVESRQDAVMTNLGEIKERFIISPSWRDLLPQKPAT